MPVAKTITLSNDGVLYIVANCHPKKIKVELLRPKDEFSIFCLVQPGCHLAAELNSRTKIPRVIM